MGGFTNLSFWPISGATGPAGPAGPAGAAGANGTNGAVWYTGAGAPVTLHNNGDFYLNTTNGAYYEQIAGAWVLQGNLTGPQGPAGAGGVSPNPASGAATVNVPFTGWTLQNVANAHQSFNDFMGNELCMAAGNFNALEWAAVTRVIAIPYTLIATIQMRGLNPNAPSWVAGVCVSDGTKYEHIGVTFEPSTFNLRLETRTLATLHVGGTQITPTVNITGPTLTVKITNDGANRVFSYWAAGAWVVFKTEAAGTFLTETLVGVTSLNDVTANGWAQEIAIKYWSQ